MILPKFSASLSLVFFIAIESLCGQTIEGANGYISYQTGNLPIVISVPHGGSLSPPSIPNRTCNDAVYATDAFTIELAEEINLSLIALTGCQPHIIYCHLARTKLDANRNLQAGACGNPEAAEAWETFHAFIETAQESARGIYNDKVFYIDLHGHGNTAQRLELGYLLYDDELEESDEVLNSPEFVGYSSVQNLVSTNVNNLNHAQLLRGPGAFGTRMGEAGYPSVPSQQIPFPGTNSNYFSGGYNTVNHTSYQIGNPVNGLQMECNFTNVRDTPANRKTFADSLATVLIDYLAYHQNIDFSSCQQIPVGQENTTKLPVRLYPTLAPPSGKFQLDGGEFQGVPFFVYDISGKLLEKGFVSEGNLIGLQTIITKQFAVVVLESSRQTFRFKVLFE